ncbi:fluoride efflux transporter CrcB [Paenibacillus filicis]|uniref:Fluoride-specific ion channel FluC n=1 Tax=Paenibacillus filicis TaxID=669464 RepID=A0ABU9DLY3_9BACL
MTWLYIGIAGIVGALARFGLSVMLNNPDAAYLPWGTLLINLSGCFLLGLLAYAPRLGRYPQLKIALTTGLIGSYTTFSTFSWELLQFVQGHLWLHAAVYVLVSSGGGLLFVRLGSGMIFRLGKRGIAE